MAYQTVWYNTELPEDIIDILVTDLYRYDTTMEDSRLSGDVIRPETRNSQNSWVPSHHWISGFLWHYVQRVNRENFLYDLSHIDGGSIQYTRYQKGQYYNWHSDASLPIFYTPQSNEKDRGILAEEDFIKINCEQVRKLSFVLQLSNPEDYTGGNLQLLGDNGKSYFAPRQRGTLIFFDSRTPHRVLKVKSGERRSLVGWVVGPRWK